jgi:hypothetical protein
MTSGRSFTRWNRSAFTAVLAAIAWAEPWAETRASAQDDQRSAAPAPKPAAGASPLFALPAPKPSSPNEGDYLLMPKRGGGYVYDDFRFTAHVAPDGHVTFRDKHIRLETRVFGVLSEKYRRAGDERPSLFQALSQVIRNDPDRPISPMLEVCQQRVDMLLPAIAPCILTATPVAISVNFDLQDELLRAVGQGWYKYEKAKFLSSTFEFRVGLAAARHAKLMREAIADIPARLDGLWRDPTFTPRERRRIMCLLWAEVNVKDADSRRAAEAMERWIRVKLPEGSADGFTAAEQASCAESSRRVFSPYQLD